MYFFKPTVSVILSAVCCCLSVALSTPAQAQAQDKSPQKAPQAASVQLKVDVCQGQTKILSQKESDTGVDIEVEVTVKDCKGQCTGTLEYAMVFVDANNNPIQWQLTGSWDWRAVDAPFTVKLHEKSLPNAKFKEVTSMKMGRCSCSTPKPIE
jgi:hypothetical protein